MVVGCGNSCVKFVLFATNFAIAILSGGILSLCLLINLSPHFLKEMQRLADNDRLDIDFGTYSTSLYVLAGISTLVLVVSLLGCAGACCESQCVMIMYLVVMGALVVLQVALIIFIGVKKGAIESDISSLINKVKDPSAFKPIQDEWNCCGVDGTPLPNGGTCSKAQMETGGCYAAISSWLNRAAIVAILIAVLLAVVQLVSVIFACVLIGAMRRSSYHYTPARSY